MDLQRLRIGNGFDVHAFAPHRKLILGGIEIPYEQGLLGHSDADVLLHAIMDSLLGAAGLGDIGQHFSDKDVKYKGANSMLLLKQVVEMLHERGWAIVNIDSVIICQRPKLAEYIPIMLKAISQRINLEAEQIHIKATTTEKLGFTGRGEGIAVEAVALIYKQNS